MEGYILQMDGHSLGGRWNRNATDRGQWKTLMEGYILQWMDKAKVEGEGSLKSRSRNHSQLWKLCPPVAILPDAWHYRVRTRTGWPCVNVLTGTYKCLSRSASEVFLLVA